MKVTNQFLLRCASNVNNFATKVMILRDDYNVEIEKEGKEAFIQALNRLIIELKARSAIIPQRQRKEGKKMFDDACKIHNNDIYSIKKFIKIFTDIPYQSLTVWERDTDLNDSRYFIAQYHMKPVLDCLKKHLEDGMTSVEIFVNEDKELCIIDVL